MFLVMLEDCLTDGYFFMGTSLNGKLNIVQCENPEGGYNGIMECFLDLHPGFVIPVNFVKEQLKTKQVEGIRKKPEVIQRNIVNQVEHVIPYKDRKFSECMDQFGHSNLAIIGQLLKKGDCFVKASILCAMYRAAGIPARVVGFNKYPQKAWEEICAEHKTYPVSSGNKGISQLELRMLAYSHPEMSEVLYKTEQVGISTTGWDKIIAKHPRLTLDPQQPPQGLTHCWAEVMYDGEIQRFNPNRETIGLSKLVFERGGAHARVFPEVYIGKDFNYRWNSLAFEMA